MIADNRSDVEGQAAPRNRFSPGNKAWCQEDDTWWKVNNEFMWQEIAFSSSGSGGIVNPIDLISSDSGNTLITGGDGKLFVSAAGGTNDYNLLINRPSINTVTLEGDRTFPEYALTNMEIDTLINNQTI